MTRLTRSSGSDDHGRWSVFEWEAKRIRVYDSAVNALKLIDVFKDKDLDPLTKEWVILQLLFPDPKAVTENIADVKGLLAMLAWEVCGLDITGEHKDETGDQQIIDWQQDEEVIKASLFAAYGRPWEELARELSYKDVLALMHLIPPKTPLGQAIYYRTADPPKPSQHNQEYIAAWMEQQEFWRIKGNPASHMEAQNNVANDMFAALEKAAKDGERWNRNNQGDPRHRPI